MPAPSAAGDAATAEQGVRAGFTVLIEGYSPYHRIADLLDPPGVAGDQSRWGIISRFENMGKAKNAMFELLNKRDTSQFKVEWGIVETSSTAGYGAAVTGQPLGIGILKDIQRVSLPDTGGATQPGAMPGMPGMAAGPMMMGGSGAAATDRITVEKVLVDPMTGEELSKTYDICTEEDIAANPSLTNKDLGKIEYDSYGKPKFIERDSWFRIQAKFVWKTAPGAETAAPSTGPF
jgi:hypothetical protein